MRDNALHGVLETFTAEAAGELAAETESGAEIPFEVTETESRSGGAALYCYRPLTGTFIDEREELITALPSYAAAARALATHDGVGSYLSERGEPRIPGEQRERADLALRTFLGRVFDERSAFGFDESRFELAYEELERAIYDGRCVSSVIAPLLGARSIRGRASSRSEADCRWFAARRSATRRRKRCGGPTPRMSAQARSQTS